MIFLALAVANSVPSFQEFMEPVAHNVAWQKASEAYGDCVAKTANRLRGTDTTEHVLNEIQAACQTERATFRSVTISAIRQFYSSDAAPHPEVEADLLLQYLDAQTPELASPSSGHLVENKKAN